MKKLNIFFEWEWERAKDIEPNWRDGLRACLENIEKEHNVDWGLFEVPKKEYDWIITWCDSNSNFSHFFTPQYKAKRAIFLTTNPTNYHNLRGFDVVFCESSVVLDEARMRGIHAVKAFGTDDNFFAPHKLERTDQIDVMLPDWPKQYEEEIKLKTNARKIEKGDFKVDWSGKDIEYFYPATFSPWKRQRDIAYLGNKLTCVGTIQPDGQEDYDSCVNNAVITEVGYFPPEKIRDYYQRSKRVIIPAVHGSERTVLESMSTNILPEVTNDNNLKSKTYLDEYAKSGCLTPREFVQKFYSGKKYAEDVLKGLYDCEE